MIILTSHTIPVDNPPRMAAIFPSKTPSIPKEKVHTRVRVKLEIHCCRTNNSYMQLGNRSQHYGSNYGDDYHSQQKRAPQNQAGGYQKMKDPHLSERFFLLQQLILSVSSFSEPKSAKF